MTMATRREVVRGAVGAAVAAALGGGADAMPASHPKSATTDRVIAGGPGDLLVARRLRLGGADEAIGSDLVRIARLRHGSLAPAWDRDVVGARGTFLADRFPAQLRRAAGAARTLGLRARRAGPDPSDLQPGPGAGYGGCVVYLPPAVAPDGHPRVMRLFDAPSPDVGLAALDPRAVEPSRCPYVVDMRPARGVATLAMTLGSALSGAWDGVNESGLIAAVLPDEYASGDRPDAVPDAPYAREPGLHAFEIVRIVLETCTTAVEALAAIEACRPLYRAVRAHFLVVDARGSAFVWEYTHAAGKAYVTWADSRPLVIANHPLFQFQLRRIQPVDVYPASTFRRATAVRARLAAASGRIGEEELRAAGDPALLGRGMGPAQRSGRTLWRAVYDGAARSVSADFLLREGSGGEMQRSRPVRLALSDV